MGRELPFISRGVDLSQTRCVSSHSSPLFPCHPFSFTVFAFTTTSRRPTYKESTGGTIPQRRHDLRQPSLPPLTTILAMEHSPSPAEFHHDFSSINFASDYASALAGYPAYEIHNMCEQRFHFLASLAAATNAVASRRLHFLPSFNDQTELATDCHTSLSFRHAFACPLHRSCRYASPLLCLRLKFP